MLLFLSRAPPASISFHNLCATSLHHAAPRTQTHTHTLTVLTTKRSTKYTSHIHMRGWSVSIVHAYCMCTQQRASQRIPIEREHFPAKFPQHILRSSLANSLSARVDGFSQRATRVCRTASRQCPAQHHDTYITLSCSPGELKQHLPLLCATHSLRRTLDVGGVINSSSPCAPDINRPLSGAVDTGVRFLSVRVGVSQSVCVFVAYGAIVCVYISRSHTHTNNARTPKRTASFRISENCLYERVVVGVFEAGECGLV